MMGPKKKKKKKKGHTERRPSFDLRNRDRSDAATSLGMPKVAGIHQML